MDLLLVINFFLILSDSGATHEYEEEPWDRERVEQEMRDRSYHFASTLWDNGKIGRFTSGIRVQTKRGNFGRMPIVGKYETEIHENAWIFTGLSSRGLIYHGVFGDFLTDLILFRESDWSGKLNSDWWKDKQATTSNGSKP